MAAKAKSAKFPKQAIIITESDETCSLYIILSGKVRVFSSDEKGQEVTLLIQEAGTHFGELALLSDETRSASAITLEKNRMLCYFSRGFYQLAYPTPGCSDWFVMCLIRKNQVSD
ncbi:MAG: cyclic nucleotide-binding domain-containing protein [Methylococcales bacterium]|nr:cyclic nucleotide-binding domain-containing protein [Methylococcales bacterium]